MDYLELKKRSNLKFTKHTIDPSAPYQGMKDGGSNEPVAMPEGPSRWSRLSGRYRSAYEQKLFIEGGCIDRKLGRICEGPAQSNIKD